MNQNPQIGPYTLQRLLGGGGMADVYLACLLYTSRCV